MLAELAAQRPRRGRATAALDVGLAALSPARRGNALRAWLHASSARGAREPGRAPAARAAARRVAHAGRSPAASCAAIAAGCALRRSREPRIAAPPSDARPERARACTTLPAWGGALRGRARRARRHRRRRLRRSCELRARAAASASRPAPRRPPRSLKKQYQARRRRRVAARRPARLQRRRSCVFVPGLGIDARALAAPGAAAGHAALAAAPAAGLRRAGAR